MRNALGIDFGTTNSTICTFDGYDYRFSELEEESPTMPSLMYVDRELYPTHGETARSRFLEDNASRQIKLEKTDLGYIQITNSEGGIAMFEHTGFAPVSTTIDARISALTDQQLPGFLFASTKRLLGDLALSSVRVFERNFKLDAIVSSIVGAMIARSEPVWDRTNGSHREFVAPGARIAPVGVCVGRPVNFECIAGQDQNEANALAVARLGRAMGHVGLGDHIFLLEPIAPVLVHLDDHGNAEDTLVIDFGGGTLDLSLVRKDGPTLQVLGNHGRALGGDIITERLIRDHIFPLMGLDDDTADRLRRQSIFLHELIPDILNWRTTYSLNQPKYFMEIAQAVRSFPQDGRRFNRIRLLIVNNYSYSLFYAVDTAKRELTTAEETEVILDPLDIRLTLRRSDLEASLTSYLSEVEDAVDTTLSLRGYTRDRISRVLLTGGTSQIPAIRRRVETLFPGKVLPIDPFTSIVKGFAHAAWLSAHGRMERFEDRLVIETG